MNIEERAPGSHWSSDVGGFRLTDWDSVDELLAFRDAQREANPAAQLLFILDDRAQAAYTGGHALDKHCLREFDPAALPSEEGPLYEKEGRLTAERWASVVVPLLRARIAEATLPFEGQLLPLDAPEVELISLYQNVDRVFGTPLDCLTIDAAESSMAIAALPNGYFVDDLTPMQNYLLAEQLRVGFGYEILGLGSFLAAYVRDEVVDGREARAVIDSVRGLYEGMTDELAADWADAITGQRWFLLSYRGS